MKWYEEKRMQRMNEDGKIDTLSVWSEDSICVPSTAIMSDDLLTNPSNDLLSTFIMGDNVVAISAYDIVIKQGGIDGKTKQYKFDYILGNNPDYTSCAHNNVDTIVQISRGDSMMRIIKITNDGVDISYKEIKYNSSPMNPTLYAFLVYIHDRFVIGIQRTDTTSEVGTYLYWSKNLNTFYKATMGNVDDDLDFRHHTNRVRYTSFKSNVPRDNFNEYYVASVIDLFSDNTDILSNFGYNCIIGYKVDTEEWICYKELEGYSNDIGYCRLCNYAVSSLQRDKKNVGVVTSIGRKSESEDEIIKKYIHTSDYNVYVSMLYNSSNNTSIFPYVLKAKDKTYIPMGDGEDGQEGKLCIMVIRDGKSVLDIFELRNVGVDRHSYQNTYVYK